MIKQRKQIKVSPIIFGIILAVFQTSFVPTLLGSTNLINLIGSLCFAFMLTNNFSTAYEVAFFVGLFLDLISVGVVGLTPFSLVAFVLFYKYINGFYLRNSYTRIIFATLVFYIIRLVNIGAIRIEINLLFTAFLTALIGYFISLFIRKNYDSEQKVTF